MGVKTEGTRTVRWMMGCLSGSLGVLQVQTVVLQSLVELISFLCLVFWGICFVKKCLSKRSHNHDLQTYLPCAILITLSVVFTHARASET